MNFETGAILNINKPLGLTSFDVVSYVKRITQCRKVGHTGTLDPLAEGVLLVCIGKATKEVSRLMELEKEYECVIELGKISKTDDAEGPIIQINPVPDFTIQYLKKVLKTFKGEIEQLSPNFSAIKYKGHRLYKLARKGESVPRIPRYVSIYELKITKWMNPFLHIRVICSRGTYIRSLARDIGEKLNTGGYLKALRRARIGSYTIQNSIPLEKFK
jgi:tRNA pseudouridine55 synthase